MQTKEKKEKEGYSKHTEHVAGIRKHGRKILAFDALLTNQKQHISSEHIQVFLIWNICLSGPSKHG